MTIRASTWLATSLALLAGCYVETPTSPVESELPIIDADAAMPAAEVDAAAPETDAGTAGEDAAAACACSGDTPYCVGDDACGACRMDHPDDCSEGAPHCQPDTHTCVACLGQEHCTDPGQPVCGAEGRCGGCSSSADCSGFADTPVCDTAHGACVACVPNPQDPSAEGCANGNACDPTTFTCTGAPRASLSSCGACVSDSECLRGNRCVETSFHGKPHGQYCLPEASAMCPLQYAAQRAALSTLGVASDYCFPDDKFTTCEGLTHFQDGCSSNAACGAAGLDDGICDVATSRCTYGCDSGSDCSGGTGSCIGSASAGLYCRMN
jgi:hypothetical protein